MMGAATVPSRPTHQIVGGLLLDPGPIATSVPSPATSNAIAPLGSEIEVVGQPDDELELDVLEDEVLVLVLDEDVVVLDALVVEALLLADDELDEAAPAPELELVLPLDPDPLLEDELLPDSL
jgi:hypothetical protein